MAYLFNFIIPVFRSSVQSTDNESNIIHNIMKCTLGFYCNSDKECIHWFYIAFPFWLNRNVLDGDELKYSPLCCLIWSVESLRRFCFFRNIQQTHPPMVELNDNYHCKFVLVLFHWINIKEENKDWANSFRFKYFRVDVTKDIDVLWLNKCPSAR